MILEKLMATKLSAPTITEGVLLQYADDTHSYLLPAQVAATLNRQLN